MMNEGSDRPKILITGAAGNLGGLLARHLLAAPHKLRLMIHRRPLPADLETNANVSVVRADLARPETLGAAVDGVEVVVHFAGVLFAPKPERFLTETNTVWFENLLEASVRARVRRIVLISFPHVEGPTTPDQPATGRLDREPISMHAKTRLEEEKLLLSRAAPGKVTPVVLRLGMVYGRGILMIEAARWLARRHLLAVWRQPTWIHLISKDDCLRAMEASILEKKVRGIYHIGDEHPLTLQEFLDAACRVWGLRRPHRLPFWMIRTAAMLCETYAGIFRTPAPLTKEFITIGRVSYCGDTTRMRKQLLPTLIHPTLESGLSILR